MINYHIYSTGQKNVLYLPNYKQAFLVSETEYELIKKAHGKDIVEKYTTMVNEIDRKNEIRGKDSVYELYLCVANMCNAKCIYCFANQGDYGKKKGLMKAEIAKKAIDFFMWKVPIDCEARITFFGGEPLLAYETIVQTCEYVNKKYFTRNHTFHITTNATLLTKNMIDFMSLYNFKVAISIDGGPQIQNSQRPLANAADSYVEATKNVEYLLNKVKHILIRGTYCGHEYNLDDCYADLLDLHISEVNVVPDISGINNERDCDKLLLQLDRLHHFILDYVKFHDDFPFGLFTIKIRELFLRKTELTYRCGAGKNTFSVDIEGNIYPCHRLSNDTDLILGNVNEYISASEWETNIYKDSCQRCWNRYTCTHGCRYEDRIAQEGNNEKNPYFCAYSKKMTEIAISLCLELPPESLRKILRIQKQQ